MHSWTAQVIPDARHIRRLPCQCPTVERCPLIQQPHPFAATLSVESTSVLPGRGCNNVALPLHTLRGPVIKGDQAELEPRDLRARSRFERVHLVAYGFDVSGLPDRLWNRGLSCRTRISSSHPLSCTGQGHPAPVSNEDSPLQLHLRGITSHVI